MLKIVSLIFFLIVFINCNPPGMISTPGNNWQTLFDGQTTNGWHKYGGDPVGAAWKVKDGYLYLDTSNKKNGQIVGGGDIVSDEEYDNFHLQLEWKISPKGNS